MNKEEILQKSRKEHQNQDPYEKEISKFAGMGGTIAAVSMCFILMCLQIFIGDGNTSGLDAILGATLGGEFLATGIKSKRVWEIAVGVVCAITAVICLFRHIYNLVG